MKDVSISESSYKKYLYVTEQNLKNLETGMSYEQVRFILGEQVCLKMKPRVKKLMGGKVLNINKVGVG